MAPLANDPRQVLLVLNIAKRKALCSLIEDITRWMRSTIELRVDDEDVATRQPRSSSDQEFVRLRSAALAHFDAWRRDVLGKLKEILSATDDARVVEERRQRTERIAQRRVETSASRETLIDLGAGSSDGEQARTERAGAVVRLQASYHAIPTRLVTIPQEDREEILSCVLLILLSTGQYTAESRALAVYLTSALELPLSTLNAEEIAIATSLAESGAEADRQQHNAMSAKAEAEQRRQAGQASRYWKVGIASVAGAALIGVTGGLAAPVVAGAIGGIMGSVGLGGVASFLGIFWMNGALVGTLFGAFGAKMTGDAVDQYAKEVEDFRFIPLNGQTSRRLRVSIGVNGWLTSEDDVTRPWKHVGTDSEVFALRYEVKALLGLGVSLEDLVTSYAWKFVRNEILKRTVLATLWSAMWPVTLLSMASKIDNPFSLAKNRSDKAGEILADAIINKVQGERPVTLVAYSLGARVVYACLRSLAQRRAFGLVDTVVFIGAPIPSNRSHWRVMRTVVSGKIYNVYSENDYLLAFLYRATSIQLGVAGLQEIRNIQGVENLNLSEEVQGHLRYPKLIDQILARCNFPVAEGASLGPIEHDEDEVVLEGLDGGKATSLIELDSIAPERPQPSNPPGTELPSYPSNPLQQSTNRQNTRATVVRSATSSIPSGNHGPLGPQDLLFNPGPPPPYELGSTREPNVRSNAAKSRSTSVPQVIDCGHQKSLSGELPNVKYSGTAREMALRPRPTLAQSEPTLPVASAQAGMRTSSVLVRPLQDGLPRTGSGAHKEEQPDDSGRDDEYQGLAIKMVDNDDGLEYLDPTPIED